MIFENYELIEFFQNSHSKRVHKFFQKSSDRNSNEVPLSINKRDSLCQCILEFLKFSKIIFLLKEHGSHLGNAYPILQLG